MSTKLPDSAVVVTQLAALAQPHRLALFRALVVAGQSGETAGKLGEMLAIAPATLSFHLKELTRAGLIIASQEGRYVRYHAAFATMQALLNYMTRNCCQGNDCLTESPCCPPQTEPQP